MGGARPGARTPGTRALATRPPGAESRPPTMRHRASARRQLNRKDLGLAWNKAIEGRGLLVGEQVNLTVEAEFVRREN